jgi:hypothetical protein
MESSPFVRPSELLGQLPHGKARWRKIAQAIEFLQQALADGSRPASDILCEAAQVGIAERTLYHAKTELGVISRRQGYHGGQWIWSSYSAGEGAND